jgi:hypothetical protein
VAEDNPQAGPIKGWIPFSAAAVLLAVAAAALLWFGTQSSTNAGNPLWFIGLLVLFGAALTVIAMVFKWMNLTHPEEAFALPPGSIRTLLAVGIMVLFAVIGISQVGRLAPENVIADTLIEAAVMVPSDKVDDEIERYRKAGLLAFAVNRGNATTPATLKLYRSSQQRPTDIIETQKQMVTTIVTLLTTVIGFYFGSRSAESALDKAVKAPTEPSPDIKKAQDDVKGLDPEIAKQGAQLDELAKASPPPDPDRAKVFQETMNQLTAGRQAIEKEREALRKILGTPSALAPADVESVQARILRLGQALTSQAEAIGNARKSLPQG